MVAKSSNLRSAVQLSSEAVFKGQRDSQELTLQTAKEPRWARTSKGKNHIQTPFWEATV